MQAEASGKFDGAEPLVQRYVSALPVRPVERKDLRFCTFSLSKDEEATVDAIIASEPFSDIVVAPNHHFDREGTFCGFRVSYPAHSSGVGLPVNRSMFFGHTIAEVCSAQGTVNPKVTELVMQGTLNRDIMRTLLESIDKESTGNEPSFECMPHPMDEMLHAGAGPPRTAIDSRQWHPELPESIGIYHAFTRGYNKDSREHKLYIACSGGCPLAAESYYNLILDLNGASDVSEICEAEETWWLRQASFRARCRLLKKLADAFGLTVTCIKDVNAYDEQTEMARASTDTVINNIASMKSGHVAIYNHCVDTTCAKNGVVNPMHPKEGIWIFRGPQRSSAGMHSMGCGWGDQRSGGIFPSGAFAVCHPKRDPAHPNNRGLATIVTETNDTIVTHRCKDEELCQKDAGRHRKVPVEFSWYDEACLQVLSNQLKWDRNAGTVELMPIIVGITKWGAQ